MKPFLQTLAAFEKWVISIVLSPIAVMWDLGFNGLIWSKGLLYKRDLKLAPAPFVKSLKDLMKIATVVVLATKYFPGDGNSKIYFTTNYVFRKELFLS